MSSKFDIFPLLGRLNKNDLSAFDDLPPHDKQQASPFMAMKFMSGCSDKAQIVLLNEMVNTYIFSSSNKQLLFKLLACSASGGVRNVRWPGQIRDVKNPLIEVIARYFDCSNREAKLMVQNYSQSDIFQMAEELGYSDDEIKKLKGK